MQPIRVLHVVLDLHAGGLERVVVELARRADRGRFRPAVLALRRPGRYAVELEGSAPVYTAPHLPAWTMVWPGPLARTIRALEPDVVHTHSGVWHKASLAAKHAGVRRLIHTDHGRPMPDSWHQRGTDWLASRRTNLVIAVSHALADYLARKVVAYPERLRVIPNGVDTARFQPGEGGGAARRALGLPAEAFVIGTVGRLDAVKGYDLALRALATLCAGWSHSVVPLLLVAGDGPERRRLADLCARLNLTDHAIFLGWRRDPETVYAAMDTFTLTSHSEGTSVSLLEAMSMGLCPVVTDVGGTAAVLGPALRGRLVRPGDPAAMAAAWTAAFQDVERRRSDGRLARARVLSAYSIDAMVRAYECLYVNGEV